MSKAVKRSKYIQDESEIERLNDHSGNQRCQTCIYGHATFDRQKYGSRPCNCCHEVTGDE